MKLRISISGLVLFFFLPACILLAQPYIANQAEPIIYPKAHYAPVIDGEMDAIWYNAPRYPMTPEILSYAAPEDWYDMSGEWRAMWDGAFLYYLVDIRDDMFLTGMDWNWDSIELYSDPDFSHGAQYDGIDDVQLRFHLDDDSRSITVYTNDQGPEFFMDDVIWEQAYTDLGWRFEAALPTVDLLFDTEPDLKIGVECQYNDNDDGTETQHKLIAFGEREEHWGNPSLFGSAILKDWPASDTLFVVKTNTQPVIDGDLDPVWNDVPVVSANCYMSYDNLENLYDLSLSFRTMWDASYIYYFVSVWDDVLMRDGAGDWEDDGVEIYFDGDYSHGATYDQKDDLQFAFRYEASDQLIQTVHLTGSSAGTPVDLSGIRQAAKAKQDEGFTLEAAFPIQSCLGINPMPGHVYGIEVDYNDDDAGGTRDTKLKTYSQTDDTWENPGKMAPAKLVAEPNVGVKRIRDDACPEYFSLRQNFPNPFNAQTVIEFSLARRSSVLLVVYDMLGREVANLLEEEKEAGMYHIPFDGTALSSGLYVIKLCADTAVETKKMLLLR